MDTECTLCHKVFKCKRNLSQHTLVHSGERPYKCKYCDKSFNDTSSLGRHHKLHESNYVKSFSGTVCDKKFTTIEYLRVHKKSHQEDAFDCKLCPKKIKGKYHFKNHVKAHTESPTVKCPLCNKVFRIKGDS